MKILRQSIIVSAIFFILCGVIYPYFMTGVANIFFKQKAQGSIIYIDGKPVGSKLIGQKFEKPEYLHGSLQHIIIIFMMKNLQMMFFQLQEEQIMEIVILLMKIV